MLAKTGEAPKAPAPSSSSPSPSTTSTASSASTSKPESSGTSRPTGYAAVSSDGFEAPARRPSGSRPAAADASTFEAARAAPVDLQSGAGAAPTEQAQATTAPAPADPARAATGGQLVKDTIDNATKAKILEGLEKAGVKPAEGTTEPAPAAPPDPADPTAGMTPDERAAYDNLTPQERQRYDEMHQQAAERSQVNITGPRLDFTRPPEAVAELRELLTSGQFDDYVAVEKALEDSGQGDKVRELRGLLFQGTLTGGDARDGGGNLLSYLTPLAQQGGTTGQGVNRHELLGQMISDIANPERIQQGEGNQDCGGTMFGMIVAFTNPAEYARVVTSLAETGEAVLRSDLAHALNLPGHTIKLDGPFDPSDKSRSPTQQLWAKSFVNDADQAASGGGLLGTIRDLFSQGLYAYELTDAARNVTGTPWSAAYVPDSNEGTPEQRAEAQTEAERLVRESSDAGKFTMANVDGHWVAVLGVSGEGPDARVYVADGTGGTTTMSMKEFLEQVDSVVYESSASSGVPEFMENEAWADPGGGINGAGGMNGGDD